MQTVSQERPAAVPAQERVGRLSALRSRAAHRIAVIAASVVGIVAGATSGAYAVGSSTDLTGGNGDTFYTKITSYFTAHIVPSSLVLLAVVVGIGMLFRWGPKAAKKG